MNEELLKSFIMLLVIMNPFGGIPMFVALTYKFNDKKVYRSANKATVVATILILIFLFFGKLILDLFGITIESFEIAGGIILLLIGITYVLDVKISHSHKFYQNDITVPMATPLIAGPGVLTTVIILVSLYGYVIPLIVAIANILLFWILMRYSKYLHRIMGVQGSEILSRIMGLVLCAIAVQFIIMGVKLV